MNKMARSSGQVFLLLSLAVACLISSAWGQETATDKEKQLRRVAGNWTLNPLSAESPEPTPPPIYASYRKKDEPPPPALDTIPRIFLELKEGKLAGTAVLPPALPMTDANRDVTGKEPMPLLDLSFDGTELKFEVRQGETIFVATARLEGRVLKGTWSQGPDKQGALYLHRRYR